MYNNQTIIEIFYSPFHSFHRPANSHDNFIGTVAQSLTSFRYAN